MVKKDVLSILKSGDGQYISGEAICRKLGISRTAVWKGVQSLRDDGYTIESVTNGGYRLISCPDILSDSEINGYLNTNTIGKNILVYKSIDSTNLEAKRLAAGFLESGSVILAETQTGGLGRMRRSFFSPEKTGIWMSILLRPKISAESASMLTVVAALAVKNAVDRVCSVTTGIKWTNDILLDGRKLCGILTEMATEAESGGVQYVVVGIGVNVNQAKEDFPEELFSKATSLYMHTGKKQNRSELAANILNEFEKLYNQYLHEGLDAVIGSYREALCMLGKPVKVITLAEEYEATAVDVDDNAALIVKKPDGSLVTLKWGEVAVRGLMGYV